jgi:HD-GYP domain-containing protein (c-di-GMP phosphodiesterase class II)
LKRTMIWYSEGSENRLSDGEIPLLARIITAADSFDSMMSNRPYRRQRRMEDALLEIQRCSGTHFDSQIVEVFLRVIKKYVLLQPQHILHIIESRRFF